MDLESGVCTKRDLFREIDKAYTPIGAEREIWAKSDEPSPPRFLLPWL